MIWLETVLKLVGNELNLVLRFVGDLSNTSLNKSSNSIIGYS